MIPKIIHYIWLSGEEYPESIKFIINGWKKILPEYKLRLWTSNDYNKILNKPQYIIDAYNQKKWAFVSDYIRVYALYTEGGWYFDSDLQIIKNELYNYSDYDVVSAIEYSDNNIQIQAAFIGGISNHIFFKDILEYYNNLKFEFNNENTLISPKIYAKIAEKYGFKYINKEQKLNNNIYLLSSNKILAHIAHCKNINKPFAIHHCYHSWINNAWGINTNYISFFNNLNKDRWIIQSFWTKPLLESNQDIEYHKKLCNLSLVFAHNSGFKVKMYTDTYGYNLLKELEYDEISTLLYTIPESISTNLFAVSKAYALRDAGIGVIHIDYDVFIKNPMCILDFYEDKSIDVILQCKENWQFWYDNIINSIELVGTTKYFDKNYKKIANTGVIGFNNQELLDKYLLHYFSNIDIIDKDKLDALDYNKLDFVLEQVAITSIAKDYNIYYVLENKDANSIGYTHLQGNTKFSEKNKKLVNLLLFKNLLNNIVLNNK